MIYLEIAFLNKEKKKSVRFLGLIHIKHFGTQYYDKKNFHSIFFSCMNWKCLFLNNYVPQMSMETTVCLENHYWCLLLDNILKCNNNMLRGKHLFYQNVFVSFYQNISAVLIPVWKYFERSLQYFEEKIYFYQNIVRKNV